MLVGIVFTAWYIIYFRFINTDPKGWWWGISPEGIGTLGMILNFVTMWIVSLMTKEPPKEVQEMVESVRYPREA